jgi:RNA polymerase sigma-70 factor (ECF subfamily)
LLENDVDDVTQNVFIAVIRSIPSFRGDAKFSTWLFTITSRQVANYYRKGERSPKQADKDIDEYQDRLPQNPGGKSASNIEDLITLRRGLAELPEDYQAIILMRLVEGYRFKEIAQEFGKSLDAVKSLFRRAVAALRDKLEVAYD